MIWLVKKLAYKIEKISKNSKENNLEAVTITHD